MIDFVPMVEYGTTIVLPANMTSYLVLYPVPDYDNTDEEFLVADNEDSNLFLERIVGQVTFSWDVQEVPTQSRVAWRLMPLGIDYSTLQVLEPFDPWHPDSSEWANLKWWDERSIRILEQGVTDLMPAAVDHPYWSFVDCKPRMLLGSTRNLWPVLAIRNDNAMDGLNFKHRLRGLYKY